jgi:histone-lysine N-methyltransferase SETMAR
MESASRAPATFRPCEIRAVIRFLTLQNNTASNIHQKLVEVYGSHVMSRQHVTKWVRLFKEGRTDIHDEARSGRPSAISDELVQKIEEQLRNDRRVTLDDLHEEFPDISRSLLGNIVSEKLGYKKLCARWVPRMLTPEHQQNRVTAAREFLDRFAQEGEAFLDSIVTGDETWVCHYTPESKRQSLQWRHSSSPATKKFKTTHSARKVMASVFWDRKGVLLVDFMLKGTTINAEAYCNTLKKLRRAIQNRRRAMLTRGVNLLHDNARPHTARVSRELLTSFGWDIITHPPYSPDLVNHLFTKLKEFLGGKRFSNDQEVEEAVKNWLKELAVEVYDTGIQKLVPRLQKCLDLDGDYVEK